ncbi:lipase family protein [Treponema sp.]|uniref:lipase family protein n=1 Tax=Treponema sp. TaxID=166 RepID=UPI003890816F
MKKQLLFSVFIFLLFTFQFSHARTVTLSVTGLATMAEKPVPVEIEWDENWFFNNSPYQYNHKIARIASLLASTSYTDVEKSPDSNALLESYHALGFSDSEIEWNYSLDYSVNQQDNNQAAYSFAVKKVRNSNLVLIVLRGTPMNANEWISNLNISDTTKKNISIHEGFSKTAHKIKENLYAYLEKNKINTEECVFLITGHSRGAALSNLLGVILFDEGKIKENQLFVYTFASPNVSQEEKTSDEKYNFIWNIVNAEDIVPSIPPNQNNWQWKKFGQNKVLINYWNTSPKLYLDNYVPRMNRYFEKLLLRPYHPFKNGPFLQIQLSRILTNIYTDTESYYRNFLGLRNMGENVFWKVFPEGSSNDINTIMQKKEEIPFLFRQIRRNVEANIEGGFDYALNACIDMHAPETYLSWIMALDENEVYSESGCAEIVFDGNFDCAVYDEEGNLLCKIEDGAFELYSLKIPVAGFPLPQKNVIGFPGNQNLNVVIHKDSLIPTEVGYKIEKYKADGSFLLETKTQNIFVNKGRVVKFEAGKITLNQDSLEYEKLSRKESKPLIKKYGLSEHLKFNIQAEAGFSTQRVWNLGLKIGTREVYTTVLADIFTKRNFDIYGFSAGLGHEEFLYGPVLLDLEAFSRFIFLDDKNTDKKLNLVPSARILLAFKPRHRFQIFAAVIFDLKIKDFNEEAFSDSVRKDNLGHFYISEKLKIFPSIQFGIRM